MNRLIIALIIFLCTSLAYADTCPTIEAIKANQLAGWRAHDSDNHKPLNTQRSLIFKNNIEQFTLAEWVTNGKRSNIRCYYSDKNGSGLEAYLTKESFKPTDLKHYWYQVSGSMHCAAGMNECLFQRIDLTNQPRLARK